MDSPIMIDDGMSSGVCCEASPGPKAHSSRGREPKQAFADTAPLAKIREELKSDETDSPEAMGDSEASGEPVVDCEPHAGGQTERSEPLRESESSDIGGEETTVQAMTLAAEAFAAQGNPVEVVPEDTGGEVLASEQPIMNSQVIVPGPIEATSGGQQEGGKLQSLVDTGVTGRSGLAVHAEAMRLVAEEAADSGKSAPVQEGEGSETSQGKISQGKAAVAVDVPAQGEPGGSPGDARPVVLQDPGAASEDGVTARHEAGVTTPETTDGSPKASQQPLETISGEDVKAGMDEGRDVAASVSEMTQRDVSRPSSESSRSASQADSGVQLQTEGQPSATGAQDREGRFSDAKEGMKPLAEVLASSQSGTTAFAERLSARPDSSSGVDAPAAKNPVQDVGEQILGSLQASLARGDRQMLVRLDPPELGSVVVRVQEQGDQISGVLEVSRDETRREIEQALPQVLRSLQEAGLQVRRLEVIDQAARDLGKEQMQQDAWAQREGSNQQGEHSEHPYPSGWSARGGVQQNASEQGAPSESQDGAGQGRIDMLV